MKTESSTIANWGNYPTTRSQVHTPERPEEMVDLVHSSEQVLARGNGRCYGDAALAEQTASTLQLNRILDFDPSTGRMRCESGVLLADVIRQTVPQGWFFHVTPGIKNITIGGAIACDVHGKNHPAKGCFSNWLESFVLLTGDGTLVNCSKTEHADLFWQTCGGMGWTGVVMEATFQLMPISSVMMRQTCIRASNLEQIFRAFDDHREMSYAAGWVDCLSTGRSTGRGVVFFAEHDASEQAQPLIYPQKKVKNIPFFAPGWILNPLSIRIHNQIIFSRAHEGTRLIDMDTYYYPLDRISNWNRLYGKRGFVQYQFCVPEAHAFEGVQKALELIRSSADTPFLTVLKRHGERPDEAIHSFPIKGYSLALDFPRTRTVFDLVRKLDELVWSMDGKVYLAKDACSAPKMGRVDPRHFGEAKFHSHMKARLMQENV